MISKLPGVITYRHFYFRLCDILEALAQSGVKLTYADLEDKLSVRRWEGVATYLMLVSDYVRRWRLRYADAELREGEDALQWDSDVLRRRLSSRAHAAGVGMLQKQLLRSLRRKKTLLATVPWLFCLGSRQLQ